MASLKGSFHLLYLFDVAEEIRLGEIRKILQIEQPGREPGFGHLAPSYVRFEHPPLEESIPALKAASGELFPARMRYFDYGVVALELEAPFENQDWPGLIALACRWVAAPEMESLAEAHVNSQLARIEKALHKPFSRRLFEDYCIVELREATEDGVGLDAPKLIERHMARPFARSSAARRSLSAQPSARRCSPPPSPIPLPTCWWQDGQRPLSSIRSRKAAP